MPLGNAAGRYYLPGEDQYVIHDMHEQLALDFVYARSLVQLPAWGGDRMSVS